MRQRIDDLPIRSKFILLFVLGVLLPMSVLMLFVLTTVTGEIRNREMQNANQSMERVFTTLNNQFTGVISMSNAMSADTKLLAPLGIAYQKPWEYYINYYEQIRPSLSRYVYAYSQEVTNVEVYTNNNTTINGGYCMQIRDYLSREEWFHPDVDVTGVMSGYVRQILGKGNSMQISILRAVGSGSPYTMMLKMDLNMDAVNRAIEQERAFLQVYLVAPDGYAISYPDSMDNLRIGRRDRLAPENPDLSLSFSERSATKGWKLVATINKEPMRSNIRQVVWFGLLIGLCCTVFAGLLSLVLARSIGLRSQRLLRHMDRMNAEDFAPIHNGLSHDEIGELMVHFNAMGERLKQLINDLYVLQLRQTSLELENTRAELKYLQAQIDPHFLFNTLNAMLVLCVRNGYADMTEIVRALSKILRRMVDTSHDTLPLREELEFVRMVLKIEQFRFGDKLAYTMDIDEDALSCHVPVMSVQGLVENACKHGVQHLKGQGMVRIAARVERGVLVITVHDNGVGIEPERLSKLRSEINSPTDMQGSVGLQNIYRRLKLHYGDHVNLTLDASSDGGTVATIRIPQEEG